MAVLALQPTDSLNDSKQSRTDAGSERSLRGRVARVLVGLAGVLHRSRRDEYLGELHALQVFDGDSGLDYAIGTLLGAAIERIESLSYPLVMRGVSKSFGSLQVLRDVNLAIQPGSITGLTGGNGVGKSTLVKLLAGETTSDGGRIQVGGVSVTSGAHRSVAVISPDLDLIESFSVAENIALSPRGRWFIRRDREAAEAAKALQLIGATIAPVKRVADLTPLERLQVRMAREVYLDRAELIVLDEPTRHVSAARVDAAFDSIAQLRNLGFGVLVVSHQIEHLRRVADRMAVLHEGMLVRDAPVDQISAPEIIGCIIGESAIL
jgi:ABC-type sugar transport system ATPase subunit